MRQRRRRRSRRPKLFGFPVVMKILSPDILHKSEIGGVLLGVADAAAVRDGYDLLLARAKRAAPDARIEGVLVAKQLQGGVECILGIHRDPVFGPIAMFGLGGIFVEVMKDVVFRRCPFGADVAEAMIRSIKGAPLLLGARGRPPADIKALAQMLARLSAFAVAAGTAAGLDRSQPGVRDAGGAGRVRGGCGDRGGAKLVGRISEAQSATCRAFCSGGRSRQPHRDRHRVPAEAPEFSRVDASSWLDGQRPPCAGRNRAIAGRQPQPAGRGRSV